MKSILALCITCVLVGLSAGASRFDLSDVGFWVVNFPTAAWLGWITAVAFPLNEKQRP